MASPARTEDTTSVAPSDTDLMLAYGSGDAAAFDDLYTRHRGGVYRYLLRHCGNAALADELFQDVWMNVVRSRSAYQPTAQFTTWLYRIAHNRVVDHWRAAASHAAVVADSGAGDEVLEAVPAAHATEPDARLETVQLRKRLEAALRELPPLQRDAFLLHQEGGLTAGEIAALTDSEPETVKSRLRYASNRLRSSLGEMR
ncbi:MAG: RNA polymerase sigma factor [Pseudomonadota bacterium]|nr:RNA polymerase sigma factor [Pseudomonadota bacterium]